MADKVFAHQLRTIRLQKGKTQIELANQLKISDKVISSYERAVREPDLKTLRQIALNLGVSLDILLGLKPPNDDIEAINRLLNNMSPQVANNIRNLLENIYYNDLAQDGESTETAPEAISD